MSEAHDRFENQHGAHPDWIPTAKPWCPECCCSGCGCPTADRLEAERMKHWDGMGTE